VLLVRLNIVLAFVSLTRLHAGASSWDVNVEAAIPLEDAAHAAQDQVHSLLV
jgi:hypothetical protein